MLIVKTNEREYGAVGVEGVEFCGLRVNEKEGGAAIIRMKKGVRFPKHNHKSDEQTLVMKGVVAIGGNRLEEGDYLYTEAGEQHDVLAEEDVTMYVTVEDGIEIVEG